VKKRQTISAPARGQKLPVTWGKPVRFQVPIVSVDQPSRLPTVGDVIAFVPIVRQSRRSPEAKLILDRLGVKDLTLENRLEVRAQGDETEIVLLGTVGGSWWDEDGITEKEVRNAINSIPAGRKITLSVNSEGGSVKEGLGIYDAIKQRAADIKVRISGYALSIASVFPLAAKKSLGGRGVVSPKAAIWMQHKAWSWAQGNDDDMESARDMLRAHNETLVDIYAAATGKSKDDIRAIMKKETWTKGGDAVSAGLADETDDDTDDANASYRPLRQDYIARCKNISPEILNVLTPKAAGTAGGAAGQPKTQTEDSMKKAIVALLKKHSIEASETETDEQLQAKLETLLNAGNSKAILDEFKALIKAEHPEKKKEGEGETFDAKKEIAALKKSRIQDRVSTYVDSTAITKDELKIFVNAALEDEEGTFKILDEKKSARIGGEAAGAGIEAGREVAEPNGLQGRPTEKLRNLFAKHNGDKAKIFAEFRDNFSYLAADAQRMDRVKNENTFSATITTNFLILGATTKLSPKFASVNLFARDASVDPYKPLASGVMKFNSTVQDGSTTLTNATNFESGDSTIDPVTVTVAQYTEAFHVTNGHFNSGFRMEDLVDAKLASLGSKISQVIGNYLKIANYVTLAPVISVPGAFGFGNMATAWGELKKANRKNIMLDGEYLARIINNPAFLQATPVIPGAGWKNVIGWDNVALHTEFSAAGANVRGFFGDETALGIIAGLPLVDSPAIPGGILAQATGMLPGVNLGIAVYAWFNTATRTYWASFDLMFGANVLDGTAGGLIASGNPG
jgi:ATP-dependent Clp protease, protease subunit